MPYGWKITIQVSGGGLFTFADMTAGMLVIGTSPALTFATGANGYGPTEGMEVEQTRLIQKTQNFRAAYASSTPRYNWENTWTCTVERSFQSPEACAAFIIGHPDTVPAEGKLIVQQFSATGSSTRYQPNAIPRQISMKKHKDLGCLARYTFAFNGPWQTSP